MSNSLKIAAPPPRPSAPQAEPAPKIEKIEIIEKTVVAPRPTPKFDQVKEGERVQFNKRVTRGVSDGFEMLAIKTRRKVPELLEEALELLEKRYGKV